MSFANFVSGLEEECQTAVRDTPRLDRGDKQLGLSTEVRRLLVGDVTDRNGEK